MRAVWWLVLLSLWCVACDSNSSSPVSTAPAPTSLVRTPFASPQPLARTLTPAASASSIARTLTPPPSPPATPNTLTVPDGVLVIYERTGCLAGVDETLTVYADGKLTFKARGTGLQEARVAIEQLARLQQLLSQPAFAALAPAYEVKGADLCAHFVAVRTSDGQTREVLATDEAKYPAILTDVLSELRILRDVVR